MSPKRAAAPLTPGDSDVASNFTLPQLATSGLYLDNPHAYGPIPGDTGSGATNYGYLYNWSAATAGESQASHGAGAGNAPHSICPAGWKLPSGGPGGDFAQLDIAFGGTGAYVDGGQANIAQWQPSGPFRGSYSGYYYLGYGLQGMWAYLWSATARTEWSGNAFIAAFGPSFAGGGGGDGTRHNGNGVRCLLN